MINVTFANERPAGSYALAIPVWSDDMLVDRLRGLPEPSRTLAARSAEAQRFEREAASIAETFIDDSDSVRRLLFVGLGKQDDDLLYEKAGGALAAKLLKSGETTLVIDLGGLDLSAEAAARIAFGAAVRSWRYDAYRTKLGKKARPTLTDAVIVGADPQAEAQWAAKKAVAEGIAFTRELVTEPANVVYPVSFVARCQDAMAGLGIEFEVLDEKQMTELGMNALLGVARGSEQPPRLLAMRWTGAADPAAQPVVLIGKGVTFDTGGISIKPAAGMEAMKWDMGGAAAVAGTLKALALRKAKANVVGICGLVENMPDGKAQRPGDIVTSLSGQTIEVINTDAEGRLVLCDAITWAQRRFKPRTMIDLATLTGAMIVSLGHEMAGMFSNDDALAQQLAEASSKTADRLWRLPLGDAYDKLLESPIADMKNVGPREAGSISAAAFLGRFVDEGVKWAHLDIAGVVWANKSSQLWDKGATGFGVALLDRYIADRHES